MLQGIQTVMKGRSFVCSQIASTLVEDYSRRLSETISAPARPLSSRENEVLQLIAEGHSTKDIACRLYLSVKTVATHRDNLKRKLGINSTAGLTKYALRHGLTSADPHH